MASNSTISISYKLTEDSNGLKKLILDSKELEKVMSQTVKVSAELERKVINFAAICTSMDSISNSTSALQSTLRELSDAYAAQEEVETKLATTMRNNMGAREEDIQSIKNLCSAQQELGVIGDEVQLSGAQELATYLSEKQSLEQLIPVMNDMLAQQYGLNATQENAAQIATMLGKVMDGQTAALSRYGYSFDDAQEKILKFGTESQRAAVLCEVIESSVGGMNAELAKTDSGKQKQLDNTLGDIKESLGKLAQAAMPFVTIASDAMIAIVGVLKFAQTIKVATTAVMGWRIKQMALKAALIMGAGSVEKATQATNIYSAAAKGSAASTKVLSIALRGLLITTGIGAAITGLVLVISKLMSASDKATDSTNRLLAAEERAKRNAEQLEQIERTENSTRERTAALLQVNIAKLKEFNGTKEQEKKLVNELNDTYGDTMGYFSSVADWYDALIANSEAYCRQMVLEAKTRETANAIAQKETEKQELQRKIDNDELSHEREKVPVDTDHIALPAVNASMASNTAIAGSMIMTNAGYGSPFKTREIIGTSEFDKAESAISDLDGEIKNLKNNLLKDVKEISTLQLSVKGSKTRPTDKAPTGNVAKSKELVDPKNLNTLGDFENKLRFLNDRRMEAPKGQLSSIDDEIARVKKLRDELELSGFTPTPIADIKTYEQLNRELAYYTALREKGDAAQRVSAQKNIDDLKKIKKAWDDVLDDLKKPGSVSTLNTIEELDEALSYYRQKQKKGSIDEVLSTQKEIDKINEKKAAYESIMALPSLMKESEGIENELAKLDTLSGKELIVKLNAVGADELESQIDIISQAIDALSAQMSQVGMGSDSYAELHDMRENLRDTRDRLVDYQKTLDDSNNANKTYDEMTRQLTGAFGQLGGAIGGAAGEWLQYGANAAQAIATAIPKILALAGTHKKAAEEKKTDAVAGAASSVSSIPFVGPALAVAAVASIVAALSSVPKFAKGGIISGPTVGLIGEYAGASNNPEVVAPLDKLRSMLRPEDGIGNRTVKFRIEGRTLVGILEKENNIKHRS